MTGTIGERETLWRSAVSLLCSSSLVPGLLSVSHLHQPHLLIALEAGWCHRQAEQSAKESEGGGRHCETARRHTIRQSGDPLPLTLFEHSRDGGVEKGPDRNITTPVHFSLNDGHIILKAGVRERERGIVDTA